MESKWLESIRNTLYSGGSECRRHGECTKALGNHLETIVETIWKPYGNQWKTMGNLTETDRKRWGAKWVKIRWKSMKISENPRKSMKIHENSRKSTKILEKSMKLHRKNRKDTQWTRENLVKNYRRNTPKSNRKVNNAQKPQRYRRNAPKPGPKVKNTCKSQRYKRNAPKLAHFTKNPVQDPGKNRQNLWNPWKS